jgi:hypothetical protein
MEAAWRPLLRWCLLLTLVLGMAAPVTLWRAHALHHGVDGVAASDPHVHLPDGSVRAPDHSDAEEGRQGHDHMPGVMAAQPALPGAGPALRAPSAIDVDWFDLTTGRLPIDPAHRLRRPPRLG